MKKFLIITGILLVAIIGGILAYRKWFKKVPGTSLTFDTLKKDMMTGKEQDVKKQNQQLIDAATVDAYNAVDVAWDPQSWIDDAYSGAFSASNKGKGMYNANAPAVPTTDSSKLPSNNIDALHYAQKWIVPYITQYMIDHMSWSDVQNQQSQYGIFNTYLSKLSGVTDIATAADYLETHNS